MATTNRPDAPDRDALLRMFEIQQKIKHADERFRAMLTSGQVQLIYYSLRGQECISAGYAVHLRPDDYVVTIYRGLHDHIAKHLDGLDYNSPDDVDRQASLIRELILKRHDALVVTKSVHRRLVYWKLLRTSAHISPTV